MRLRSPRSLASQLIWLLVLAVVAAQVSASAFLAYGSSAIFAFPSTAVGRVSVGARTGDRFTALVHVLNVVPPDLVPKVVENYQLPFSRFSVDDKALVISSAMGADEAAVANMLVQRLGNNIDRVNVRYVDSTQTIAHSGLWRETPKTLLVSSHLTSGRWLNMQAVVSMSDAPFWLQIGLVQLGAAIVAILVTLGLGLRHVVRPMTALADAAEQFGLGVAVTPLPERGPREMRTMTASFNAMQARLRAFVSDRTRMLGAISHDLRTPLSSLWLRVEMVDDDELREAMVRTLSEMKGMVEATLAFARDDAEKKNGDVDLADLARQLADDHRVLGRDVAFSGPATIPFHGRAPALRRALDNLVENATRYGERARVTLIREAAAVLIRIDDDGPGLPPERIEDMFEPFVRLDASRNAQTGGTGLGLAIARSAIREHGGDVTLLNLTSGGLRAQVVLPLGGRPAVGREPGAAPDPLRKPDADALVVAESRRLL